ncbi:hypothetical protein ACFFOS_16935 [Nocardioides kongjuensis]|uniref:Malonyl CoA-acyl carrier protein transacylase n=1 Tax=Nocardioides kongjuensis TaxID=349522 RepID=A0A852RJS3_9ACTN|nr:hypothetical protein [Nocardioides kongjuensis]NYD33741.1 malonyl CoA-acyl carrier protein transacylase [Nocardioides kongjuensis]
MTSGAQGREVSAGMRLLVIMGCVVLGGAIGTVAAIALDASREVETVARVVGVLCGYVASRTILRWLYTPR